MEENQRYLEVADRSMKIAEEALDREKSKQERQKKLWEKVEKESGSSQQNSLSANLTAELEIKEKKLGEEKVKLGKAIDDKKN